MMTKTEIGAWGELQAANEYQKRGYKIVARNYRSRPYEIDLIVSNEVFLVFCEVKTRQNILYGTPGQGVNLKKRQCIINGAKMYLSQYRGDLQPRIDVCEVVYTPHNLEISSISIIENAFTE